MATDDSGDKDEIKTHFATREGTYKLMPHAEYSKPSRDTYTLGDKTPVAMSFVPGCDSYCDKIAFNVGKELYFYDYKGCRKAPDLTKPIDKRIYKGTFPTCHDFNLALSNELYIPIAIGFTAGQIQLIDPLSKDLSKLFNEDRALDKGRVTCIKWVPSSPNIFMASYTTGCMYTFDDDIPSNPMPPVYQLHRQGDGFSVFTCKSRSPRNPVYRWQIGEGTVNQFAFSPCHRYVAVVSQDGYMRVIDHNELTLYGYMRSYFGGLLCVCWSNDGQYLATGGEDDLITVWSFQEKRVICRGKGHKSWVSAVMFDHYTSYSENCDIGELSGSEDTLHRHGMQQLSHKNRYSTRSDWSHGSNESAINTGISYRLGSVGQDGLFCLWEISEDIIRLPFGPRQRASTLLSSGLSPHASHSKSNDPSQNSNSVTNKDMRNDGHAYNIYATTPKSQSSASSSNFMAKFATLDISSQKSKEKEHKRNFSLGSKSSEKLPQLKKQTDDSVRVLGTPQCPRLHEVPLLEPMVCKKVSHERLTGIVFKEDCIVTSNQNCCIQTWARPNWANVTEQCQPNGYHFPFDRDSPSTSGTAL